jgi:hypothetical protein
MATPAYLRIADAGIGIPAYVLTITFKLVEIHRLIMEMSSLFRGSLSIAKLEVELSKVQPDSGFMTEYGQYQLRH